MPIPWTHLRAAVAAAVALACAGPARSQDIAVGGDGSLLVSVLGGIVRVDPQTGAVTVLSSASVGSGPAMLTESRGSLALEGPASLVVADSVGGNGDQVVRVDTATGDRAVVSGPATGSGPLFTFPRGIAVLPDGSLAVAEGYPPQDVPPAVFRVDPVTGDRAIVSDAATGSGRAMVEPVAVAADADGQLIVADWQPHRGSGGFLRRHRDPSVILDVDPVSGDREVVSGTALRGGAMRKVPSVAVEANGDLVAVEWGHLKFCVAVCPYPHCEFCTYEDTSLTRIDRESGVRQRLSGGGTCLKRGETCLTALTGQTGDGPSLRFPAGLALEADNSAVVVTLDHAVLRVDAASGDRTLVAEDVDVPSPAETAAAAPRAAADLPEQHVYRPLKPRRWLRNALGEVYGASAGRPLASALEALSPEDRQAWGVRLYPAVLKAMREVLGSSHPDTVQVAKAVAAIERTETGAARVR